MDAYVFGEKIEFIGKARSKLEQTAYEAQYIEYYNQVMKMADLYDEDENENELTKLIPMYNDLSFDLKKKVDEFYNFCVAAVKKIEQMLSGDNIIMCFNIFIELLKKFGVLLKKCNSTVLIPIMEGIHADIPVVNYFFRVGEFFDRQYLPYGFLKLLNKRIINMERKCVTDISYVCKLSNADKQTLNILIDNYILALRTSGFFIKKILSRIDLLKKLAIGKKDKKNLSVFEKLYRLDAGYRTKNKLSHIIQYMYDEDNPMSINTNFSNFLSTWGISELYKKSNKLILVRKQIQHKYPGSNSGIVNINEICENKQDYTTYDDLNPNKTIVIYYNPASVQRNQAICYDIDALHEFYKHEENIVARWIKNPNSSWAEMDNVGHAGIPDLKELFYKLPPYNTYIDESSFEKLIKSKNRYYKLIEVEKNVRIGNTNGDFGVGRLHGQLPGVTIYKLYSIKPPSFNT